MMNVEELLECLAGKTEVLGENLSQCDFVHQKSHMTWPGLEPGKPATTGCMCVDFAFKGCDMNRSESVKSVSYLCVVVAGSVVVAKKKVGL
jgi:hypothetical protein